MPKNNQPARKSWQQPQRSERIRRRQTNLNLTGAPHLVPTERSTAVIDGTSMTSSGEHIHSGRDRASTVELSDQRRLIYKDERQEMVHERMNNILNGSLRSALEAPLMTFVRLPQSQTGPFRKYKYTAKDVAADDNDVCCICLCSRAIDDSVIELSCPCSLKLHEKCAGEAFTGDSRCPVCRNDLRTN